MEAQPRFLHADVPLALRNRCVEFAREAAAKEKVESAIAAAVKRRLEAHDGALWHVVVGRGFGASVAHEAGGLLSFQLGPLSFLAFRSFDDASLVRPQAERRPAAPAAAAPDAPTGGGDATAVAAAAHDDDHEGDGET